jgi:cysteine desulfurase
MARKPAAALEDARTTLAEWAGVRPRDVIFASGATEANHLALRGCRPADKALLAVSAVEHPSVLAPAQALGATFLPVDASGRVLLDAVDAALESGVGLVSVMAANNETGVLQPLAEIHARTHAAGALLHVDAAQVAARMPLPQDWDCLTLSGHKAGGLKGAGALLLREGLKLFPQQLGGDQERNRRAGTVDVGPIVGLVEAVTTPWPDLSGLRDQLQQAAEALGAQVSAKEAERLPNTLHIRFEGLPGDALVMGLDLEGICISTGSACASGASNPSHVLEAMGLDGRSGLRFSLGWNSSESEIQTAAAALDRVVAAHRSVLEAS